MSKKHYHNPMGDPCIMCGGSAFSHRVSHKFQARSEDTLCKKCLLPESKHKYKTESERKRQSHSFVNDGYGRCEKCGLAERRHRGEAERRYYIGIDGEGQGREKHRYVMLAASDEAGGRTWVKENPKGLSTIECFELLLELPTRSTRIFSFAFNYDLTKILQDVDSGSLFYLFRPELRSRKGKNEHLGPKYVDWNGYQLNMQGTKFVLMKDEKRIVIWDMFKFFQSKFVTALKDWKVGSKELWERMTLMKDKRAEFDKLDREAIREYCLEECRCMATLARKLIESHEKANLKLKSYYGAGSSGGAMLTAMGIKDKIKPAPLEMKVPVACGFFGGRFENSVIGVVDGPLYDYDISSAYPYQLTFLPCLEHGQWEYTTKRKDLEGKRAALVQYSLGPKPRFGHDSWGPFPFRTDDGSISFPITSGGGWVWLDEYLAGERHFPHVHFKAAWTYSCDCDCQPFKRIPEYYVQRLIIGKEGPGIVIKLGCNSCYGKLAQSVGNALFNSWVWAGMITSGTRAQMLDVMALHKDRANLLTIATDGIKTRERIVTPIPRETGTGAVDLGDQVVRKPLGGWEEKLCPKGLFVARPGIYFPMNPTLEELKEIRGRGVGKGVVLENCQRIVDAWEEKGLDGIATVANVSRFCGAKTSISYSASEGKFNRSKNYGQWISRKVEMSFSPMPKRSGVNPDGKTLTLREFSQKKTSVPYRRAIAIKSAETAMLRAALQEALEQPDVDMSDYEVSDG